MIKLSCDIKISDYQYKGVVDLSVDSSSENLTDTAILTFPQKVKWKDKSIKDLIKRGDSVVIKLGYDDSLTEVFSGYIKTIKADIPITVECDDMMFKLKKNPISTSFQNTSLDNLLKNILPSGITYSAASINLGKMRINGATPAEVLSKLKDQYGIYSWFKNGILYSGLQYLGKGKNHIINYSIDDFRNLEYIVSDDISYQVSAISIYDNNTRIEEKVGDEGGEKRQFYYYNIDRAELKRMASVSLVKLKYDGYRGSLQIFGKPIIAHGDTFTIKNQFYPEREGTYIVKSVRTDFGQEGFKQTVEIDRLWN